MAIAPSKLGRFVWPMLNADEALLRNLRVAGLVSPDVPDEILTNVFRAARDEHNALPEGRRRFNSPEERVRVFLQPYLSDKGRRWAVPLDSLDLPDDEDPIGPPDLSHDEDLSEKNLGGSFGVKRRWIYEDRCKE